MGETACEAVEGADDMELAGRADPALDTPLADVLGDADVMVDFTTPTPRPGTSARRSRAGVHAVVGTTGFDLGESAPPPPSADGAARCFVAPNFAIGAVLMMQLARRVAPHMPECEIVELHHEGKLDAPSGTAKRTADLIADAGGRVHEPIHSVRLPGLVAHQEVIFGGEGQTPRSATTRPTGARSCPGSCSPCGESASCPTRSLSGSSRSCSASRAGLSPRPAASRE